MKNSVLILVFTFLAGSNYAQSLDSLRMLGMIDSMRAEAHQLWQDGRREEAILVHQHIAEISRQKWGEHNVYYAASLYSQAMGYLNLEEFDTAAQLLLKAIEVQSTVLGRKDLAYVKSLDGLACVYREMGDFSKAEPLFLEAKKILEKTTDQERISTYCHVLFGLAYMYQLSGEFEKAEHWYVECQNITKKATGEEDIDILQNLAMLYSQYSNFEKAKAVLWKAMEIQVKAFGQESLEYAKSSYLLGKILADEGDYKNAEPLLMAAKDIELKTIGKENSIYVTTLEELAILYRYLGKYAEAEPLFFEAKNLYAELVGKNHPLYANALNNLAAQYRENGAYSKAEPLFLEAVEIRANTVGVNHIDYAKSLNSLAILYQEKNEYEKAEKYFSDAKNILSELIKVEPIPSEVSSSELLKLYSVVVENLGILYTERGDYAKAEQMLLEVQDRRLKSIGKDHPDYAVCLSNLSYLYDKKGEYEKSESLCLEAMDIVIKTLGKENPDYSIYASQLATLYEKTGQFSSASRLFLESNGLDQQLIKRAAGYLSENQLLAYLPKFEERLAQFQSFAQVHPNAEINSASYDNALFYNGFLLESARMLSHALITSDRKTQETFEQWQVCQVQLAQEYTQPIPDRFQVTEIEDKAESYEKKLIKTLSIFKKTRQTPHWKMVRDNLQPNEVAIEFIHFPFYSPQATDSILYAALILHADSSEPQMVPLFEEKQLNALLPITVGGNNFLKINALYAEKPSGNTQKTLYELIWQPLESALKGISTVYIATSGLLHRINLAAIPNADGMTLGEKKQLILLGSTRQLIGASADKKNYDNNAYLAGGIRYDTDSTAIANANRGISWQQNGIGMNPEPFPDSIGHTRGARLDYLPATAIEVQIINQFLANANLSTKVDTGFYATEEAFRQLGLNSPSPRIIHIATHGYFFPAPNIKRQNSNRVLGEKTAFRTSVHPMIRSGLIMAGANQAWFTGTHPQNQEDGILTAYEISQMDLSNTELVVLSACETGLGDIVGNEGVYGLQRAFKIAGAKYLIMSLWKVDDQSTQEFMTEFYEHWLKENLTIPKAFQLTQKVMRSKHPSAFDWAGFVLIE